MALLSAVYYQGQQQGLPFRGSSDSPEITLHHYEKLEVKSSSAVRTSSFRKEVAETKWQP